MSRQLGAENPWAMSPAVPASRSTVGRGVVPIKKESWRPAAAQSSWTPPDKGRGGPSRQEDGRHDRPYGPERAMDRGYGDNRGSASKPPPPVAPRASNFGGGRASESDSRVNPPNGSNRYSRVDPPERPHAREDGRAREKFKAEEERSWSAWNKKTQSSDNRLDDDRGARPREDERDIRRRLDRDEEDRERRWRDVELAERDKGRGVKASVYRSGEVTGRRRSWGKEDSRQPFAPPLPPLMPGPSRGGGRRSSMGRDRSSATRERSMDRGRIGGEVGGRASPDYGVGGNDRGRSAERSEMVRKGRSRSRESRPRSPISRRESSPPLPSPRSTRARSPPSLPPAKRQRDRSPSTSISPHRRNYSSTSSSSPSANRRTSQPASAYRSDPRARSPIAVPSSRFSTRRSPSPLPPTRRPSPPPPRHRQPSPPNHRNHSGQRPPLPPPRGPRQPSPQKAWGRQPLQDQRSLYDHGAPSHQQSRRSASPPPDAGASRKTWATRRDRWAEGVARGQDEHQTDDALSASYHENRRSISPSKPHQLPMSSSSPPRHPAINGNPNNHYAISKPAAIKIDLSLARAPPATSRSSAVQHLFDDKSTPSTPTTAGLGRSSPPPRNGLHQPPPIHLPPFPPLISPLQPPPPPPSPPVDSLPPPPESPDTPLPIAKLAEHQQSYSAHLASIAPYVQAAFKQWVDQHTAPALPEFLAHYFGRPPTNEEVEQILQLQVGLAEDGKKEEIKPDPTLVLPSDTAINGSAQSSVPPPTKEVAVVAAKKLPPGEVYERLACVGEGTYGKVYKAKNIEEGSFVAMKRIRMEGEKDGFPVTAMREIKLLQGLKHENVIGLVEMMVSKGSVYMIFEYMEHDLTGLLAHPDLKFTSSHIKSLNYQMLDGLAYLHDRSILHRDLKGSNILLDGKGVLKLADFGLARFYSKRRRDDYTNRVITLWYRSPELLLGETVYGPEVDIWSAGCIMLELFVTKPIFQGTDEISQLESIYAVLGTPSTTTWPQLGELPWYELVRPKSTLPNKFREAFKKWLTPAALDLAEGLLTYDPAKRVSAAQALKSGYFTEEEAGMERPEMLEKYGEQHELDAKVNRRKKREGEGR